jgi:hypothetical protein
VFGAMVNWKIDDPVGSVALIADDATELRSKSFEYHALYAA